MYVYISLHQNVMVLSPILCFSEQQAFYKFGHQKDLLLSVGTNINERSFQLTSDNKIKHKLHKLKKLN